jgi:hypothetical protein
MAFPWSPGQVLTASALNDEFGSKLPYSFGTATPTTTTSGFLWYDSNSTPAATKFWNGSAFVPFGGKILQIVRATDSTNRSTTSTSFVDASLSVTITPQKNDSAIILIGNFLLELSASGGAFARGNLIITDSSNNAISGATGGVDRIGIFAGTTNRSRVTLIAYSTPATDLATTYKIRFSAGEPNATAALNNSESVAQIYAIEVSA